MHCRFQSPPGWDGLIDTICDGTHAICSEPAPSARALRFHRCWPLLDLVETGRLEVAFPLSTDYRRCWLLPVRCHVFTQVVGLMIHQMMIWTLEPQTAVNRAGHHLL